MVYLFLADGFEEIEALGTIDILRRCGLEVQTLSVTGKRVVKSARGIIVKADSLFRKNHLLHTEALVFPGGLKSAETMEGNSVLRLAVQQHAFQGTLIAANCAGPMILGRAGVLNGRHATIYPGMEKYIQGSIIHNDALVISHGNIITACGPAATHYFAFEIARRLVTTPGVVDQVAKDMIYSGLDTPRDPVLVF